MITILTAGALALGVAIGAFVWIRLGAKPVEDPENEKRRRRIEEWLGLRQPPDKGRSFLPIPHNPAPQRLLTQGVYELRGYSLCQDLVSCIEALGFLT
jgi:hypothetical protein